MIRENGLLGAYDFVKWNGGKLVNIAAPNDSNDNNPAQFDCDRTGGIVHVKNGIAGSGGILTSLVTQVKLRNDVSIAFKIKITSTDPVIQTVFFTGTGNSMIWVYYSGAAGRIVLDSNNSSISSTQLLKYGSSYNVVVTFNKSTNYTSIYINGILDKSTNNNYVRTTGTTDGAIRLLNYSVGYAGHQRSNTLSLIKIYNRLLSDTEIREFNNSTILKPYIKEDFTNYPLGTTSNFGPWVKKSGGFTLDQQGFQSLYYIYNFSSGSDNWINYLNTTVTGNVDGVSDGILSYDDCLMATVVTAASSPRIYLHHTAIMKVGRYYKMSYKFYMPISNTNTAVCVYAMNALNVVRTITTKGQWLSYTDYFECGQAPTAPQFAFTSGYSIGDVMYLKDMTITEIPHPIIAPNTKFLKCTTSGIIGIKSSIAYGTWEFDWLKYGDSNDFLVNFIATSLDYATGYRVRMYLNEDLYLRRDIATGGFQTAQNYFKNVTWYKLRITRTTVGVFSVYIKGGTFTDWTLALHQSGLNPITDNTYTTSTYFILDIDTGDCFANLKIYPGIIV